MISAEATIKRKRPEVAAMSRWGHTKYFPRFPKSALHEFHQVLPQLSHITCYTALKSAEPVIRRYPLRAQRCRGCTGQPGCPCPQLPDWFEAPQVHGGTPVFVIEDGPPPPASPKFTCHLTIPALATPHGGYEETSFTAVARAKKAAEHAAAEKALEFITTCGLLPPAAPAMPPMPSSNGSLDEVG